MAKNEKVIYAMYDDDGALMNSAKSLVDKGVRVRDVFSPFPIHGIDPIIGVKPTRLGDMAFIYGLIGMTLAIVAMRYFMIVDWPMNIGGKPSFSLIENLPAFVPITFEFTVLCAAHGMAITYLLRCKTVPFAPARNPDPRTTDDKFVMEIRTEDNHQVSASELSEWVSATNPFELEEKDYEVAEEDKY
ncbi:DUF3341 domain-containing protein [Luteibaculum oceani]|uniref:DUF3341 domain-containing protein n=1 Tax=Luteibaculum oceani TaxID=1294296 RepID=A0A5C6VIB8_9FLAO|nr:DUF3341 domain-containing protein [Luteibaculum oceani]TXC85073.1 DUF3341 domain-containing protein [Luteibaculum oceani]